jgi:hypothetical protein
MRGGARRRWARHAAVAALSCASALALAFPGLASSPGPVGRILFESDEAAYVLDPRGGAGAGESGLTYGLDAAWAPHGDAVAVAYSDDGPHDLYVSRGDGADARRLTRTTSDEREPTWSPDGKQIAFASDRDGDWDIYVTNLDGTDVHNLTSGLSGADDRSPKWSPDGKLIAFQTARAGDLEVFTIHPDGSDARDVSNSPYTDTPTDWSLDSSTILFDTKRGSWDVYAVGADGTNPHPIIADAGSDTNGVYSPDGKQIAFASNRIGHFEVFVAQADGSGARQFSVGQTDAFVRGWQSLFDEHAPSVHALPLTVASAPKLAARFAAQDAEHGRVGWAVRFPTIPRFDQYLYEDDLSVPVGQTVTHGMPFIATLLKLNGVHLPRTVRYCIAVTDASDNPSGESCSTLTIKSVKAKPKPKAKPAPHKRGGK